MLVIEKLHAFYGNNRVLHNVSFSLAPGEIVALLGRNGSGRSTLAKAIMGLVRKEGALSWGGTQLEDKKTYQIAQLGIGYVPENKDIFSQLTVHQNLQLGQKNQANHAQWSFAAVYAMFPQLQARQHVAAGFLSGGEQQMLALGRTLMGNPNLIIVDEPTEGLAPYMVDLVGAFLLRLKAAGVAVLLIEQKLAIALAISDRVLVMGRGELVFMGTPTELHLNTQVRQEWLEI